MVWESIIAIHFDLAASVGEEFFSADMLTETVSFEEEQPSRLTEVQGDDTVWLITAFRFSSEARARLTSKAQ